MIHSLVSLICHISFHNLKAVWNYIIFLALLFILSWRSYLCTICLCGSITLFFFFKLFLLSALILFLTLPHCLCILSTRGASLYNLYVLSLLLSFLRVLVTTACVHSHVFIHHLIAVLDDDGVLLGCDPMYILKLMRTFPTNILSLSSILTMETVCFSEKLLQWQRVLLGPWYFPESVHSMKTKKTKSYSFPCGPQISH